MFTAGVHFQASQVVRAWPLSTSEGKCSTSHENCLNSFPELTIVFNRHWDEICDIKFLPHLSYLGIVSYHDLRKYYLLFNVSNTCLFWEKESCAIKGIPFLIYILYFYKILIF